MDASTENGYKCSRCGYLVKKITELPPDDSIFFCNAGEVYLLSMRGEIRGSEIQEK